MKLVRKLQPMTRQSVCLPSSHSVPASSHSYAAANGTPSPSQIVPNGSLGDKQSSENRSILFWSEKSKLLNSIKFPANKDGT